MTWEEVLEKRAKVLQEIKILSPGLEWALSTWDFLLGWPPEKPKGIDNG
jgi:hypothetical protein